MAAKIRLADLVSMSKERVITENQYQLGMALNLPVTKNTLQIEFTKMMEDKRRITLNPKECYTLLQTLDHDSICRILRRNVEYISEITLAEYHTLMRVANSPRRLWITSHNHPIKITPEWEYGWQESNICRDGNLWYLKSHNYFMADIDTTENPEDIFNRIHCIAAEFCITFRVYRTYAGYHVHMTSGFVDSKSEQSTELMNLLKCDIWYSIYSQRCGFKIRLSPKIRENGKTDLVGKFVRVIGKEPEIPEIVEYLDLMSKLIFWHENSNEPVMK